MRNIKLTLQYDGTRYSGWQRQTSRQSSSASRQLTVQETLEQALEKILREKIRVIGSGRTDAGVHAIGQVAHFHTAHPIELFRLKGALNAVLPRDIAVVDARQVDLDFHARFDARAKTYRYLLIQTKTRSAFCLPGVWSLAYPLDLALMRREAACLVGRHDFRSFQASDRHPRKSVTTIKKITVTKGTSRRLPFLTGATVILFEIEGTGFLRGMVRNIVGTLIDIGRGKLPEGSVRRILRAKDRRQAGMAAPAAGLCLAQVTYA